MSEEKHELVIIRHRHNHEEAHHGGAWKIAFADFMTAMMALFLVLWLISTTTPKVKTSIARYFNPVKLVELTPLKKGFNDPVESEAVPGAEGKGPTPTDDNKQREKGPVSDGSENAMAGKASHSEAALFRDPYAVLAEIVSTDQAKTEAQRPTELTETSVDAPEPFRDPFTTIPAPTPAERVEGIKVRETPSQLKSTPTETSTPSEPAQPRPGKADAAPPATKGNGPKRADAKVADEKLAEVQPAARTAQAQSAATAAQPAPTPAAPSDVTRLQTELVQAIAKGSDGKAVPQVEVRGTDEGLLISLTDEQTYSMFSVGSAEPQAKTIHAMEAVAQQLKNRVGQIIIRGFTDGRPYKSPAYDNWRLSSARAHMAQYMLIRGGLDEKRIAAIEGLADRRPKNPSDPLAPENRRIEILLRMEKPK